MRAACAVTVLLLIGFLFAGSTAAQGSLLVETEPVEGRIAPLTETVAINGTVGVPCSLLSSDANATAPALHLEATGPAWLTAEVAPAAQPVEWDEASCETHGRVPMAFSLDVQASAEAPALQQAYVRTHARLVNDTGEMANGVGAAAVEADYYAVLAASTPHPVIAVSPGDTVHVPVHVRNDGNGITRVYAESVDAPAGWRVNVPDGITLEAPLGDVPENLTSGNYTVVVRVPADAAKGTDHTLLFNLTALHAFTPRLDTDASTVEVTLTVPGLDVPAPAPLLAVLGPVAAALVARRRRYA